MTRQGIEHLGLFLTILALAMLAFAAGCGDSGRRVAAFDIELNGLPPIEAGKGHYEAWIAFPEPTAKLGPGAPSVPLHGELELISIGKFQIEQDGHVVDLEGNHEPEWTLQSPRDVNFAAEAWISIETEGDADTIPSGLLLAGAFTGSASRATASLTSGYRSVFDLNDDLDLGTLAGAYTLETPSDVDTTNEARGVYFESGGLPGLNVPELDGEAIVYEGWLEDTTSAALYSTGRFVRADTLDLDGAGFGGVGGTATLFPGQEYVLPVPPQPPLTLDTGPFRAFVSLEPEEDNDPLEPSGFVLLSGLIPAGAPTGTPLPLTNVTASLPTATVVLDR